MAHGLEPFVALEVTEVEFAAATDGEAFHEIRIDVGILELVGKDGIEVEAIVSFGMSLEFLDLGFEGIDFLDGALEGKAERIHRAFEALEEIDLHHGDENLFTALLGESAKNLVLVGSASRRRKVVAQITRRVVE